MGEGETSAAVLRIRTMELAGSSSAKTESFDSFSFSWGRRIKDEGELKPLCEALNNSRPRPHPGPLLHPPSLKLRRDMGEGEHPPLSCTFAQWNWSDHPRQKTESFDSFSFSWGRRIKDEGEPINILRSTG
jgi:hypothetical protein